MFDMEYVNFITYYIKRHYIGIATKIEKVDKVASSYLAIWNKENRLHKSLIMPLLQIYNSR